MSITFAAHSPSAERPPLRSVWTFLGWLARRQPGTLALGIAFGIVWMACQAVWPLLLGRAIDAGSGGSLAAVGPWLLALLGVVVVQSLSGMLRHRMAVSNFLRSSLSTARLIGHHSADTGRALTSEKTAGEIVATVTADANRLGEMFDVVARLAGAVLAWAAVSIILFTSSFELGLIALLSVPVSSLILAFLVRPLQYKQAKQRAQFGALATLGADAVAGLRILRGVGGEEAFVERYTTRSQAVRRSGAEVASVQSWLNAAQVLIPGIFLAAMAIYGARLVLDGRATPGELVTVYGYASFLVQPISTGVEAIGVFTRGFVASRRVLDVLRVEAAVQDRPDATQVPPEHAELVDVASGAHIAPGRFTAIVSRNPDEAAAVATRLGRFDDLAASDAPVLWGGIDSTSVPLSVVRKRIVVNDAMPHMFRGSLLEGLDLAPIRQAEYTSTATGQIRRVNSAIETAAVAETVSALPEGLEETVTERGRSFSGGERQRLSLARALLTDAEVLVLIEPTSAVDSRTEQRIAERLADAREGRTTVVVTASPLLLEKADTVLVLDDRRVVGEGRHGDLLGRDDDAARVYRSIVTRTPEENRDAAADR
ncbi:ABC transporter ATP-binding protein [Herbiconiux sp. L3-i23]|uniref:ABC transporter ATP-binding protein n=1 Tax=Herbiconiux sp. L3-i23 TaxID=2905871 RepID=UPI002054059B|nr:ABC transporter ATP-binding protein [Herbiconiux sp. L3-i23]BDI21465.1 multidrug ABC transporter permease [Herbiconiux sp. L3-i23]